MRELWGFADLHAHPVSHPGFGAAANQRRLSSTDDLEAIAQVSCAHEPYMDLTTDRDTERAYQARRPGVATLMDTPPDKIVKTDGEMYVFYFAAGKDIYSLPIDAEYTVVYSPSGYTSQWHAIRYRIVPGAGLASYVQAVDVRQLSAEEMAHFETLIAGYQTR